jgi:hypothetical protein
MRTTRKKKDEVKLSRSVCESQLLAFEGKVVRHEGWLTAEAVVAFPPEEKDGWAASSGGCVQGLLKQSRP